MVWPELGEFQPPTSLDYLGQKLKFLDESGNLKVEHQVDLIKDFAKRGLQVIVKLTNIHLTLEKPEYAGGTWHMEGQLVHFPFLFECLRKKPASKMIINMLMVLTQNEHICATVIYYYDVNNITNSHLSFHQQCNNDNVSDISYGQEHHKWLSEVFGCKQNGPAIQDIGSVATKEGCLITFPNVLQHHILPFQLLDKSKPSHRKIFTLFLVDPHMKIISSVNVPCQQQEWWAQELPKNNALPNLPPELANIIMDDVEEFLIRLKQAKELRLELCGEALGSVPVRLLFTL